MRKLFIVLLNFLFHFFKIDFNVVLLVLFVCSLTQNLNYFVVVYWIIFVY